MLSRTSRASSTKISRSSLSAAAWLDGRGAVGGGVSAARGGANSCSSSTASSRTGASFSWVSSCSARAALLLQCVAVKQVGFVGQHRQQAVELADRTRVACDIGQALGLLRERPRRLARCGLDVVGAPRLGHSQVDRARCTWKSSSAGPNTLSSAGSAPSSAVNTSGLRVVVEHAARPLGILPEAFYEEAERTEVLRDAAELVGLGRDLPSANRAMDVCTLRSAATGSS